ncbi:MAG: hypothetical protein IPG24_22930 [Leptospiraceae bacterium]|nr:hypothetical protein [Leptospiraceae bacterium]
MKPIARKFGHIIIVLIFSIVWFSACNKEPVMKRLSLRMPEVPPQSLEKIQPK